MGEKLENISQPRADNKQQETNVGLKFMRGKLDLFESILITVRLAVGLLIDVFLRVNFVKQQDKYNA